jgi:glycosyltransferase involved in cell wall biosynthesis
MNNQPLDISVIFSTYNREDYLAKTLTAMCNLDMSDIQIEFVVVDNNSSDRTKEVVESFVDRLPIRYLFELRPGKNCALNHVIDTVALGEIAVFIDDDIVPCRDWLKLIKAACERYPEYHGFGGKIELIWPDLEIPGWTQDGWIKGVVFANHEHGDEEFDYQFTYHPGGPNFWVRSSVFADGRRYDESRGPRPGVQFRMGSEASFLLKLQVDGFRLRYIPEAVVGHHVQPYLLNPKEAIRRAYRMGLGAAYRVGELPRMQLFERHPTRWRMIQRVNIWRHQVRFALASMWPYTDQKVLRLAHINRDIGYHKESLDISQSEENLAKLQEFKPRG